jgi:large repetitive protein
VAVDKAGNVYVADTGNAQVLELPAGSILTATSTAVTSSANSPVFGQAVTFTATVTTFPGAAPTGTVTFSDASTTLGTVTLTNGSATFTTSNLAAGSHTITAAYSGDPNFTGSEGSVTQTVKKIATSTTLASSANPSIIGGQVTYTATVSPAPGGGTVTFTDNGTSITGCIAVTVSGGTATCATTPGTTGAHNIVASFNGSSAYAGSPSATVTQVVTSGACSSLAGCNLSGVNLTGAQLAGANLTHANLNGATLTGADLAGANLSGANLNGASLTGADLKGAIVTGTTNFNMVTWSNTTCPDGTNSNNHGGTCAGHL